MVLTTFDSARPVRGEDGAEVLENAGGLLGDPAVDQLAGGGIEPDLAGREQEAVGAGGLAVGADRAWRAGRRDVFDAHQKSPSMVPSGWTRIASADGVLLSPGIVMISPASATTNPAPALG